MEYSATVGKEEVPPNFFSFLLKIFYFLGIRLMSMRKILLSVAVLSFGIVSVAEAQPDSLDMFIRIGAQDSYSGLLNSVIILAPGTYTADIWLRETVGGGTAYLGSPNNSNGLTSAGINYSISGTGSSAASPDTTFQIESSIANTSTTGFVGGSNFPFGAAPPGTGRTSPAPGVFESKAGTFQFTFGGPTATILFSDPGGSNTSVFLNQLSTSSQVLDSLINFRGGMIATAAVPEPSSLMLLGAGVVGLSLRRGRRGSAARVLQSPSAR